MGHELPHAEFRPSVDARFNAVLSGLQPDSRVKALPAVLQPLLERLPRRALGRLFFDYGDEVATFCDLVASFSLPDALSRHFCLHRCPDPREPEGAAEPYLPFYYDDAFIGDAESEPMRTTLVAAQRALFLQAWERLQPIVTTVLDPTVSPQRAADRLREQSCHSWLLAGTPHAAAIGKRQCWGTWFHTPCDASGRDPAHRPFRVSTAPPDTYFTLISERLRCGPTPGSFELRFCFDEEMQWYRVDMNRALILDEDGDAQRRLYLALGRGWSYPASRFRGYLDLLRIFEPCGSLRSPIPRHASRHHIREAMAALADYVAGFRDHPHFRMARRLSRHHRQIWHIASLLAAADDVQQVVARFEWAAGTLPTLWYLADYEILEIIAEGRSLRRAIPGWTTQVAAEAARSPCGFDEARWRLNAAVLSGYAGRRLLPTAEFNAYAGLVGLHRPWQALTRPMAAFVRCWHDYEDDRVDWDALNSLGNAIRGSGFLAPRNWSLRRLFRHFEITPGRPGFQHSRKRSTRRHKAIPGLNRAAALPAIAIEYPTPEFDYSKQLIDAPDAAHSVSFHWIANEAILRAVASRMGNCLANYDARLRKGRHWVFYAVDRAQQAVAGVFTLRRRAPGYEAYDFATADNEPMPPHISALARDWLTACLPQGWQLRPPSPEPEELAPF